MPAMSKSDQINERLNRLEAENARLRQAVGELSMLNELAGEIATLGDPGEIVKRVVAHALRAIPSGQGVITLVDTQSRNQMQTLIRQVETATLGAQRPDQLLLGWMLHHKKPLIINDPHHDATFAGIEWDASIRSVLCAPIMAIFGAPISHGNDCKLAVDAAIAILNCLDEAGKAGLIPHTQAGIGLHAGEVVAGTVGSNVHREYKITGDVVNVAARVEKMNKQFDSRLLISEAVWKHLDPAKYRAVHQGAVPVSGRMEPVSVYQLA